MVTHKEISAGFIATAVGIVVLAAALSIVLPDILRKRTDITLGSAVFKTSVAVTDLEKFDFYKQVNNMKDRNAVLLVYPAMSRWSVDLDKIDSSIDVVWLDQSKRVVEVMRGVRPNSLKNNRIIPDKSSRYTMIMPKDSINSYAINIGSSASFIVDESGD